MTCNELGSLNDIYKLLEESEKPKQTSYILQFCGEISPVNMTLLDPTSHVLIQWTVNLF